jgi:hypothetical protein
MLRRRLAPANALDAAERGNGIEKPLVVVAAMQLILVLFFGILAPQFR